MAAPLRSLLILGCGYVGERLAAACLQQGMHVIATTRSDERAAELAAMGIEARVAPDPAALPDKVLAHAEAVLDSIPLARGAGGLDAGQITWVPKLAPRLRAVRWAGYLSTTGVYGDVKGAWVDESTPCRPSSRRGSERLKAEAAWLHSGLPAEVFRLAGIYGPGRNLIARLRAGGYKAVRWQPPHFANRVHVDDIVAALLAALQHPRPGRIVNVCDDMPLPHAEYVTQLAAIIGAPAPVILTPEQGRRQLSPAALEFFADNKRVCNRLLHAELLPQLNYPDFRRAVPELVASPDFS